MPQIMQHLLQITARLNDCQFFFQLHLCHNNALAFDEFLSSEMNDYFTSERKLKSGRRNHSALYIGPTAMANSFEIDQAALRRAKSAESILCSPRIILNRYEPPVYYLKKPCAYIGMQILYVGVELGPRAESRSLNDKKQEPQVIFLLD